MRRPKATAMACPDCGANCIPHCKSQSCPWMKCPRADKGCGGYGMPPVVGFPDRWHSGPPHRNPRIPDEPAEDLPDAG